MPASEDRIHERARLLAADAIDGDLEPRDAEWLETHLESCADCRQAADDFAEIRAELHALPVPDAPRDLWARTSAALDEIDRSRQRRHVTRRLFGGSPSMLGSVVAVALVVVAVGVSVVNQPFGGAGVPNGTSGPIGPVGTEQARTSASPEAQVVAIVGDKLYVVDKASGVLKQLPAECAGGQTCTVPDSGGSAVAPVADAAAVNGVSMAGNASQAAVWTNQSVSVVPVTTPGPKASPSPTLSASASPTATTTVKTTGSVTPSSSAPVTQPPASVTPAPAVTAPVTILSGYQPLGQPQFSPDNGWLAFTAVPINGSTGPDVFVWQNGLPTARAVTSSHAAVFSGWLGNRMLISQVLGAGAAAPFSPLATPAPSSSSPASASPSSPASPSASASASASAPAATSPSPSSSASPASGFVAVSYVVSPGDCAAERIEMPMFRPVADPTGTRLVYWSGTVQLDPKGRPQLKSGNLYYDLWANVPRRAATVCPNTPGKTPTPSSSASASPSPIASTTPATTPTPFASAPVTPPAAPSAKPSVSTSTVPGASPSPSASPQPTQPPLPALPQIVPVASAGALTADWTARWDPAGRHVGIWVPDAIGSDRGQLSLFAADPATERLSVGAPLLATPAADGYELTDATVVFTSPAGVGDGKTHIWHWPVLPPAPAPLPTPTASETDDSQRPGG